MQGPIPWWDQPPDSRDNTVSMPRVDPAEFADRRSSAGSTAPDNPRAKPERPAFGDPYALPAQPEQAPQAPPTSGQWPSQSVPDLEPAAWSDPEAESPLKHEAAEPADQEADAGLEPEAAGAPEPGLAETQVEARAALEPGLAAPLVEAPAAPEPSATSAAEPAARTTPEEAPAATTAAPRARRAATAETTAGQLARSVPAEPARIAPVAAEQVADLPGRDLPSGLAASARPAPSARSAPRPVPKRQAATEMPLDAQSVQAGPADRPAPGTIADLRARLARLPAGHPASPYDDTGRPKPAPTRLRMLELGLPARPAGVASYADPPGFDHGGESDGLWPDSAAGPADPATAAFGASDSALAASDTVQRTAAERDAATPRPAAPDRRTGAAGEARSASSAGPASAETGNGVGTATGGSGNGATPGNRPSTTTASSGTGAKRETRPQPAEEARTGDRRADEARTSDRRFDDPRTSDRRNGSAIAQPPASGQNGHRGRSTSADWRRPYDVPDDSDQRTDGSAPLDQTDLSASSWPTIDVTPRNGDHRNDSRAGESRDSTPPGSARRQAQRSQPWPTDPDQSPARPPAAERRSRPAVTDRLSPAERELVDRILAACRAAEGRNAVGGYGSSGLTPAMMRIAAQLPLGGLAPGSEANTLKSADRLAAKLARQLARQPGRSAEQVAASIGDAIRYAFTFDAATYTEGTLLVHRKLKTQGFELEARRNRWDSPEYRGVFTRWRDPAHGLPFEVQFHTGQSWAFVKHTHETYVRITDPATPATERARLRAQQATAAEVVQQPPGCHEVGDFRAGARDQLR